MSRRNDGVRGPGHRRWLLGLTVALKAVFGAALALLLLVAWHQWDEARSREAMIARWADADTYAVFFPNSVGNDAQEFASGGHATKIAQARDLYPLLDRAGALFVDASNYEGTAPEAPPIPAWPMRVNTNYLARYPVLDPAGQPVVVSADERDWVVLVPETYRADEARIRAFFTAIRVGDGEIDGAVQGQERFLREPAPDRFRTQAVKLVWIRGGQDLFSFDSVVNPAGGNTVRDPIVEVMTAQNSLTIDRMNAIRGRIDQPLKVRVDGDPARVLAELQPTLRQLRLDDNLQHLVTSNEAMLATLGELRRTMTVTWVFAGLALLASLAFSVALIVILSDALAQLITVRVFHGMGRLRAYREVFTTQAGTWAAQVALAVGATAVALAGVRDPGQAAPDLGGEVARLLAILVPVGVVEVLFIAVVTAFVERRNTARRLKEM